MAEGEEKKSGGHEKKKTKFPTGFRFQPTNEELVKYYLLPRLQGRPSVPNDAIIEANVYQCHPDKLIGEMYKDRGENGWYFLSPRARKYQNGDRPSRNTDDGLGRWKASTGKKEAVETLCDGKTKFCGSVLAYFEGPIKTEKKTKWLMQELTIPQYENKLDKSGGGTSRNSKTLDEYVMCRIYVTPRHKKKDGKASSSSACQEACSSSSQPGLVESDQGTSGPKLSEKQAGKRPVVAQPRGLATAPKRARQPTLTLGPPAPMYGGGGGGMQSPFRTSGYYAGTGQPMVSYGHSQVPWPPIPYNGQAPMQWPHVAAYNGQAVAQAPMQPQPVAHNGQAPMQRPQMTAYNGQAVAQAPVQRLPVAYHGQAPTQQAPVLRLVPPYRAAPAPNSFGETMMVRPSNQAGQAVRPPSVPRPPQQQKQPETHDARTTRVYQQHMEEFYRTHLAVQPPGNAPYAAQQQRPTAFTQQQQQPYFGADVQHHVGPMVPEFQPYNCYPYGDGQQYQCSSVVPSASDSGGATAPAAAAAVPEPSVSEAANEGSGTGDCHNDGEKHFVELATVKMSPDGSAAADGDGPRHDAPH